MDKIYSDPVSKRTRFWLLFVVLLFIADYYIQYFTGHYWHEFGVPLLKRLLQ